MNLRASSVRGAVKKSAAGLFSISRPRCSSTTLSADAFGLAEIVGGHHHLDAARADSADDVLDRFGGGRIEACRRFVEKQHLRVARQGARQCQPLLLAARKAARRAPLQAVETDQRQQFDGAARALVTRHIRRGQRVTHIVGGAAPEHGRALEQDGAPRRRRRLRSAPGDASARGGDKSHGRAQQRGLAGAIRADQKTVVVRARCRAIRDRGSSRRPQEH